MKPCFNGFAGLLGAILWLSGAATGWGGSPTPKVHMRFHVQANEVLPKDQLVPIQLLNPPQLIYIRKLPEVTERHFQSIERLPSGAVLIQLNAVGRGMLEAATSSYQGMILVVLCNGRVLYDAVIDVPLRDGRFIIPGGMTDEEIRLFQELIERNRRA
ncbi:MAG: hypothetical protein SNJ84_01745 [Verrucomicrobiia bacterium]